MDLSTEERSELSISLLLKVCKSKAQTADRVVPGDSDQAVCWMGGLGRWVLG